MADALSPEVMKLARETACHIYDPYSSKSAHEYVSGLFARALTADRASCQARVEELEANLETRDKFIVDQGLWSDFVASLPPATLRALADRKEGDA